MDKFVDLHMHTTFSDGSLTPTELMGQAKRAGLACVAITDHDTVAGLDEAEIAANNEGIELMPAVEISTYYKRQAVHILGYMVEKDNVALLDTLGGLRAKRVERLYRMVDKLANLGYAMDAEEVFEFIGNRIPGRALLAKYMVKKGFFGSVGEVFDKILGDTDSVNEPVEALTPFDAIELVSEASGVSSLAHPGDTQIDELIPALAEAGLGGIESLNPLHGSGTAKKYGQIAIENGLIETGGSDYHGSDLGNRKLGDVKLHYEIVERIKELATCPEVSGG